MIDNTTVDVLSIGKDDSIVQSIPKTDQLQETKREAKAPSPATFEVDEVSRDMLDNNANNPQGVLSEDTPCARFENVHTVFRRNGTISKARNVEPFKKPLPAMITEIQYTCIDKVSGTPQIKATTMGVAVDVQANMLRCVQSTSDESLSADALYKHVLNMMTHHCGFKLMEHRAIPEGK
ncbi:MAG: hypothetical protein WCG11_03635 [Methylococcaceae bacterium]